MRINDIMFLNFNGRQLSRPHILQISKEFVKYLVYKYCTMSKGKYRIHLDLSTGLKVSCYIHTSLDSFFHNADSQLNNVYFTNYNTNPALF